MFVLTRCPAEFTENSRAFLPHGVKQTVHNNEVSVSNRVSVRRNLTVLTILPRVLLTASLISFSKAKASSLVYVAFDKVFVAFTATSLTSFSTSSVVVSYSCVLSIRLAWTTSDSRDKTL